MNPVSNPFVPSAGSAPPELAGREDVIRDVDIGMRRMLAGKVIQAPLLVGLRGVGKTVLLEHLRKQSLAAGVVCVAMEAPEGKSLPELLVPQLRTALLELDRWKSATDKLNKAWGALRNFVSGVKVKYEGIEIGIGAGASIHGIADSGDVEQDLRELLIVIGEAAQEREKAVALFIDELQYVPEQELGWLIAGLHACSQRGLPITMVGAGLPQLIGNVGKAKSYAERLFKMHHIDALGAAAARDALRLPARREGADFDDAALAEILRQTRGYPYFIQEWGDKSWLCAERSPITRADVDCATERAIIHLDDSFFRVRYDRCTPAERLYMRAMAECGDAAVRSGDVAAKLHKQSNQVAPVRNSLIRKGMVYSPAHGDAAFTVPMFAEYLKRRVPKFEI